MQQRRTADEPAPPRTYRPLRQIVVYLCITYGLTLAIALALPHAGITPLIAIAFPVIAVALTVALTVPRGQRRAVWAAVGFNTRRGRGLLIAVLGPAAIIALSFGVAAASRGPWPTRRHRRLDPRHMAGGISVAKPARGRLPGHITGRRLPPNPYGLVDITATARRHARLSRRTAQRRT